MIGHGVGADSQIRATARLIEVTARGAGATPLRRHGTVHWAETFLLIAVEIVGARIARLYASLYHCMEQRIVVLLRRGDAHRAVAAVIIVGTDIAGFRFTIVGQTVEVAPVLQSRRGGPVIEVHGVAADIAHAVNERRSAQPFTASALHTAMVHMRFWLGLVGPVIAFALQRESQRGRHLGAEVKTVIRAARFQQQDGSVGIFR